MKQKIQIVLLAAMALAAVRLGWIFYQRHQEAKREIKPPAPPLNLDYYVIPKKLYIDDLKSARELTKQPVWVKVGYAYPYYLYRPAGRKDFGHETGKLLPIQKIQVKQVVTAEGGRVLAVFQQDGSLYVAPIGNVKGGSYRLYADDMFYVQDPHELYKHWPPEVWQAIDRHEMKPGMSELQANFAIGIGLLQTGSDSIDRTLQYPNGGKPLIVTFHDGKAISIKGSEGH